MEKEELGELITIGEVPQEEVCKDLLQDGQEAPPEDSLEADLEALADEAEDYQPDGGTAPIADAGTSLDYTYLVLYSKLLVRRLQRPEITAQFSGIHKPETAEDAPCEAEVLAVGSGRLMQTGVIVPLCVRPGDRVLFKDACGHDILINGQLLTILQEDEVSVIARRA